MVPLVHLCHFFSLPEAKPEEQRWYTRWVHFFHLYIGFYVCSLFWHLFLVIHGSMVRSLEVLAPRNHLTWPRPLAQMLATCHT